MDIAPDSANSGVELLHRAPSEDPEDTHVLLQSPTRPHQGHKITQTQQLAFGAVALVAGILVIVAVTLPALDGGIHVSQSPNDDRLYRWVSLDNGIEALLISDPSTDRASASVDVHVGSWCDPDDTLGLAHFLEHMLFMGTSTFPDESEFSSFLAAHGGRSNAYTSSQDTNFFFDVQSDALRPALARFAGFFTEPLLKKDAAEREMNAVNSEYQKDLNLDSWKGYQVLKHVSNPKHPFHRFSTGALSTLNHSSVHQELTEFHETYYQGHFMRVVVLGREEPSVLKEWLAELFSAVPSGDTPVPDFSDDDPFPPSSEFVGNLVQWLPTTNAHSLTLQWSLPSVEDVQRKDPVEFMSYMMSDEGEGSVLKHLRSQGWAHLLSTETLLSDANFCLLNVEVTLTNEGLLHWDEVVSVVFSYISLVRQSGTLDLQAFFQDNHQAQMVHFNTKSKQAPMTYTNTLSARMHTVQHKEDLLDDPSMRTFSEELLHDRVLQHLTVGNMEAFLSSPDFNAPAVDWEQEPWYGTRYNAEPFAQEMAASWTNAVLLDALALPPRNPFLPSAERMSLLPLPSNAHVPSLDQPLVPVKVESTTAVTYVAQEAEFREPKLKFRCLLGTEAVAQSAESFVSATLYADLVEAKLSSVSYSATVAGLSYSFDPVAEGFSVGFSGYSDMVVFQKFMQQVLGTIAQPDLADDSHLFDVAVERLHTHLLDWFDAEPYNQAARVATRFLQTKGMFDTQERLQALDDVTLQSLVAIIPTLWADGVHTQCLAFGNVDETGAESLTLLLTDTLKLSPSTTATSNATPFVLLPDDSIYILQQDAFSANQTNAALLDVRQMVSALDTSSQAVETEAYLSLLAPIIDQAAFEQLRTQEQLGYVVACRVRTWGGVLNLVLLVMSATHQAQDLWARGDVFYDEFADVLKELDEEQFQQLKVAAQQSLSEKPISFEQRFDPLWDEVSSSTLRWTRSKDLHAVTEYTTRDGLLQFYDTLVSGDQRREFAVQLLSSSHRVDTDGGYGEEFQLPDGAHLVQPSTSPGDFQNDFDVWS